MNTATVLACMFVGLTIAACSGTSPAAGPGAVTTASSAGSKGIDKKSAECGFGECVPDGAYCVVQGALPRDCNPACCN